MSTRRLGFVGTVSLLGALAAAAGCSSDNTTTTPDAPPAIDAKPMVDAAPPDSATPDAPAASFSGTIAINDVSVFGVAAAGHGGQINVSFTKTGTPVEGGVDMSQGIIPCAASYIDITKASEANPTVDDGSVTFTITRAAGTPPTIPPCTFAGAALGYRCVGAQGTAATSAVSANSAMVYTVTDNAQNFTADQVGRYLIVTSGTGAGSAFAVVGASGHTLGLQVTGAAPPATIASYIIAAGTGPVAFTANPDGTGIGAPPSFLDDGDTMHVKYVPNATSTFSAFDDNVGAAGGTFALDAASQAVLAAPIDLATTTDLTLGCDNANCNTAAGTVVVIDTTDTAPTAGDPFPAPTKFSGTMTCANLGAKSVTVPYQLLNVLHAASPKALRISIFREGFLPKGKISVVAGHGIIAFQTPK